MKGSIIIILATMLTQQGWASKARVNALQLSPTVSDERDILTNPAFATSYSGFFTLEAGSGGATLTDSQYTAPKAEGGFSRMMGEDARLGAHVSKFYSATTDRVASGFLGVKNPVDLHYAFKMGAGSMGVGLGYSSSDEKTATGKQSFFGLNVGYAAAAFDVALNTALIDSAEVEATGKYNGAMPIEIFGSLYLDALQVTGAVTSKGFKVENAAGNETKNQKVMNISAGVFQKTDVEGGQFFYGGTLNSDETKESVGDTATTSKYLLFKVGAEANATSWLDLRGAISQPVLFANTKTTTAGVGDEKTLDNSTSVSAGATLKFNKLKVDASLASSTPGSTTYGQVNGNSLIGDIGLTYSF